MSPVTIRDVARQAGVGVGTVSRVINKSDAVSDSTRQKVLAAIAKLDFTPHSTARRLSLGKTLTVAVVLPFFTFPSYIERLRGVDAVLGESPYDLVLFNVETPTRRDAVVRDLSRRERVDGVLIMSLPPTDSELKRFRHAGLPVVLIDGYHSDLGCVFVDDVKGGYIATRHLIDLGHRRIGFISDYLENPMGFISMQHRFVGYYQALEEADISFRPQYHRQGRHGRAAARAMAHELLSLPNRPTAIFAHSDTQAIGAIEAANDLGLRVPEELSVIGYDDIDAAAYLQLTTVQQLLYESGEAGTQMLLDQLLAAEEVDDEPHAVELPVELVVRGTTGPPPVIS